LVRCQTNRYHDAFQIFHHIVISEPEHAVPTRCKPFIAPPVVLNTGFEIVALAVNLDDELAGMRDKVRDVTTHWALPPKSERGKSVRL
jgi:hypothetical protein